jgi:hypothetical protein
LAGTSKIKFIFFKKRNLKFSLWKEALKGFGEYGKSGSERLIPGFVGWQHETL